jgi:hypothetical protein
MQRTRQWIADAETRLEELNKDAQIQARTIDAMVKGKTTGGPPLIPDSGGSLTTQQRTEAIIALTKMGWKPDEIAKSLKTSIGVVQLTLDTAPKD